MNPLKKHLNNIPIELVDVLQVEFQKLHQQFFLGKWEPSQLDGGRFAEIVFRILEFKQSGIFTPIGEQIDRLKICRSISNDSKIPESIRFHILKLADLILDFRNKRNVGHPSPVNVNEMDSNMVLQSANWIVSELICLETKVSPADAQNEVKKIIERKVPLIEDIGGRLKCLNQKLKAKEKVLVFCYQKYPTPTTLEDLAAWAEHSNKTVLRKDLVKLSKDCLIDFRNDLAVLTKKGILWVEKNINFEIEL
jgi:hypothetical protein